MALEEARSEKEEIKGKLDKAMNTRHELQVRTFNYSLGFLFLPRAGRATTDPGIS